MKKWKLRGEDKKLFGFGAATGVIMLSIALASVPTKDRLIDDSKVYQNVSEIRAKPDAKPSFDSDIAHLSQLETRYREKLPVSQKAKAKQPKRKQIKTAENN
jgi:hypothetical protein